MAQYTVTHTCGHQQVHQLYGPIKDRQGKVEWLQTTVCTECYKSEQTQKRAEQSAQAAQVATTEGWPTLIGTEKQIAWAETIRAEILGHLPALRQRLEAGTEAQRTETETHIAALIGHTDAAWWINHRTPYAGLALAGLIEALKDVARATRKDE